MEKTNGIEQQAADAREYVVKVEDGLKEICGGIRALVAFVQSRQRSDDDDAEMSAPTAATRESHSSDVVNVPNDLLDVLVRNDAEASSSSVGGELPPLILPPRDGGEQHSGGQPHNAPRVYGAQDANGD